jgi:hypothetical protein
MLLLLQQKGVMQSCNSHNFILWLPVTPLCLNFFCCGCCCRCCCRCCCCINRHHAVVCQDTFILWLPTSHLLTDPHAIAAAAAAAAASPGIMQSCASHTFILLLPTIIEALINGRALGASKAPVTPAHRS